MSRAAEGFRHLANKAKNNASLSTPTWGAIAKMFEEAAKVIEDSEYEDRMGEDM